MSYNQKGQPWYRMPALGLVASIVDGTIDAQPDEGFLYDAFAKGDMRGMHDMETSLFMLVRYALQTGL